MSSRTKEHPHEEEGSIPEHSLSENWAVTSLPTTHEMPTAPKAAVQQAHLPTKRQQPKRAASEEPAKTRPKSQPTGRQQSGNAQAASKGPGN